MVVEFSVEMVVEDLMFVFWGGGGKDREKKELIGKLDHLSSRRIPPTEGSYKMDI